MAAVEDGRVLVKQTAVLYFVSQLSLPLVNGMSLEEWREGGRRKGLKKFELLLSVSAPSGRM